jgi:predicted membrane protein
MLHPNSHPTFFTIALLIGCAIASFVFLRFDFIPQPRSARRAIVILTVAGLCLRLIPIQTIHNEQISDFQTFHELACALCSGDGFAFTGGALQSEVRLFLNRYDEKGPLRTAFRLPGAPLMFAAVYSIFGQKPLWGKLLNAALGTGIGLLIFLLLYPENFVLAFRSSLLWQFYPTAILATNLIGTEIPFTACILLCAVFLKRGMRFRSSASAAWCALSGLFAGYACIIRPAALFLMVCGVGSIIVNRARFRKKLAAVLFFMVAMSLAPALWGLRNYRAFGVFEFQTTEIGPAWWIMTRNIVGREEQRTLDSLDNKMHTCTDEFDLKRTGIEIGKRRLMLAAQKISFVKLLALNHCRAWNQDHSMLEWVAGFPEHAQAPPLSHTLYNFLANTVQVYYLVVITLAIFGGFALRRLANAENPGLLMLFFYLAVSSALLCVFQGTPRYHLPLMPVILIVAAHGMGLLKRKTKPTASIPL